MTPITFPSQLVQDNAPYKVYRDRWAAFVDRLRENSWMLEGQKIPLDSDYDNFTDQRYLYVFFHPPERYVTLLTHDEYKDMDVNVFIEFTQ